MPPKRKEDKKHEEDLDISTLPPWTSVFIVIEWDSSLQEISNLFPYSQFHTISKADIISYAKERGFILPNIPENSVSSSILAKSLSEKITILDLQGRKNKREYLQKLEIQNSRTDSRQTSPTFIENSPIVTDPSKPDKVYMLTGYPKTVEDIQAMARYGLGVNFYFYIKPEDSSSASLSLKAFKDAIKTSEKNSPLRVFMEKVINYDINKYLRFDSDIRLEEVKFERLDTQEIENKPKTTKGIKKNTIKEVIKEEVKGDLQAIDVRKYFISDVLKTITEHTQLYIKYLNWKESTPSKPLFPSNIVSEVLETMSYAASTVINDPIRTYQDLPSLDDIPRPWDFRVFNYLFNQNDDNNANIESFIISALQHLSYSQLYLSQPLNPIETKPEILWGSDFLQFISNQSYFYAQSAKEYFYKIFNYLKPFPVKEDLFKPPGEPEIGLFFDFAPYELHYMLLINRFQEMITKATGKVCALDKNFTESLLRPVLNASVQKILAYSPDILTSYHSDGTLLIAVYFASSSTVTWEHAVKVRPSLQDWKEFEAYSAEFYDIDEFKINPIKATEKSFCPENGGILRCVEYSVLPFPIRRCYAILDNTVFGLAENGKEWWYCNDLFRLTGTQDEMTVTVDGIVITCSSSVLQQLSDTLMAHRIAAGGAKEVNRVVTGKASVIVHMPHGGIKILFSNGNVSEFNGAWVVTNNRGLKTSASDVLAPVPCACVTDPRTGTRTTFREDGTVILDYPGRRVVEFMDGTRILTTETSYLVESPYYAPVKIDKTTLKYEVVLSSGYIISNTDNLKIQGPDDCIYYKNGNVRIGEYALNLKDSTIFITDTLNNYYKIGTFCEPKQVIAAKPEVFSADPMLYVIDSNGDGFQLLNSSQLQKKLRGREHNKLITDINGHSLECYLSKHHKTALQKGHLTSTFLHEYIYPEVFQQIKTQIPPTKDDLNKQWGYLYFTKYPEFTEDKRNAFKDNMNKYIDWKKQYSIGKEFGFSEFSDISFEVSRNLIKQKQAQKQNTRSYVKKILSELKIGVEGYILGYINTLLQSDTPKLNTFEPINAVNSPVVKKSKRVSYVNSSINSTIYSLNYFKSPEGLDLSFESSVYNKTGTPRVATQSIDFSKPSENEIPDSPYISLVPESTKKLKLKLSSKPSCFSQLEKLETLKQTVEKQFADEYRITKTKDYDIYGDIRKSLPEVKLLRTSSPMTKINQKYVLSEIIADKKVKTTSQANKPIFKIPAVQAYRRSSNPSIHKSLIISDYINDPYRKVLEIIPSVVEFGDIAIGKLWTSSVLVRNDDNLIVRFKVKQPDNKDVRVVYKPGPIAPGMMNKLVIEISSNNLGPVQTEFQVYCKSEIYSVFVRANATNEISASDKMDKAKGIANKIRRRISLPSIQKSFG